MMKANELRIGNVIQCYRKPHHRIMSKFSIKSLFYDDGLKCYMAELNDGFFINIDVGIVPVRISDDWLRTLYKKIVTPDPHINEAPQLISYEIKRNVYLLDWYDVENKKETFILQIGAVVLDNCCLNYIHELVEKRSKTI